MSPQGALGRTLRPHRWTRTRPAAHPSRPSQRANRKGISSIIPNGDAIDPAGATIGIDRKASQSRRQKDERAENHARLRYDAIIRSWAARGMGAWGSVGLGGRHGLQADSNGAGCCRRAGAPGRSPSRHGERPGRVLRRVDSAVVAAVAHEVLGDEAVALTAVCPSFPPESSCRGRDTGERARISACLGGLRRAGGGGLRRNNGDRCYFCKSELFELARDRASSLGLRWVADGTILDDLGDHRPGLKAAEENAVRHPLVEARMDKASVRSLAMAMGLTVWDKPSFACLGSRFAPGTRVTKESPRPGARGGVAPPYHWHSAVPCALA